MQITFKVMRARTWQMVLTREQIAAIDAKTKTLVMGIARGLDMHDDETLNCRLEQRDLTKLSKGWVNVGIEFRDADWQKATLTNRLQLVAREDKVVHDGKVIQTRYIIQRMGRAIRRELAILKASRQGNDGYAI